MDLVAVYTDNCCQDRALLEEAFTSCLRPGRQPAITTIPAVRPTWSRAANGFAGDVNIKGSLAMIHQLQNLDKMNLSRVIVDCQWTRAIVTRNGRRNGAGRIADLQLAFRDARGLCQVIVFHLAEIVRGAGGTKQPLLPLGQFLDRHAIAGVHIRLKLAKLARDYGLGLHDATSNALELAHLAYDAVVIDDRGASLDDIVSSAANQVLPLLGSNLIWEGPAAVGDSRGVMVGPVERDVAITRVSATLAMFELSLQRYSEVSRSSLYGENVIFHDLRGRRLGLGTVLKPRDAEESSGPSRQVLVRVNVALCPRRRVDFVDDAGGDAGRMLLADLVQSDRPLLCATCNPQQISIASDEVINRLTTRRAMSSHTTVSGAKTTPKAGAPDKTSSPDRDEEDQQEINYGPGDRDADECWYGRVKLDAFHALQRISSTLNKRHELFQDFSAELRDSMFIVTESERRRVRDELRRSGWTREQISNLETKRTKAFLRRCQRTIPAPDELWSNLEDTFASFRDRVDTNGVALFSDATEGEIAKLKVHVEKGCLSDPPDAQLYFFVGADGNRKLRCVRGTSSLEGYHRAIRALLSCRFHNPETMHHALTVFNLRWNLTTLHRMQGLSTPYHFELEDMQEIARLASQFGHDQYSHLPNLDDVESRELFGVRAAQAQHIAMDDWSSGGSGLSGSETESDADSPLVGCGTARTGNRQSFKAARGYSVKPSRFSDACFTPSSPSDAERALFDTLLAKFNHGGKTDFRNLKRDWDLLAEDGLLRPASIQLLKEYSERLAGQAGRNLTRAAYRDDTNLLRAKRQARTAARSTSRTARTPSTPIVTEIEAGGLYRRMASDADVDVTARTAKLADMGFTGLLPQHREPKPQLCSRCHHAWSHPDLQRHSFHQMADRGKRVCTAPAATHVSRVGRSSRNARGQSSCANCSNFQLGAHLWAMPTPPTKSSLNGEHKFSPPCSRDVGVSASTCACPPLGRLPDQEMNTDSSDNFTAEPNPSDHVLSPQVIDVGEGFFATIDGVNLSRPNPSVYTQATDGVWSHSITFQDVLAVGEVIGNDQPWLETILFKGSNSFESVLILGDPLSAPRPAGLDNPHTICYANAAVKFLLSSPAVAHSLLSGVGTGSGLLVQALQDIADTQVPGVAVVASCLPVLTAVESLTNWSHAGDDGRNQHDANMFLTCLLDVLSPKSPDDQTVEPPWLASFQFGVTSTQICSQCSRVRRMETFTSQSFPLPGSSVQGALDTICDPVIQGGHPIYCADCGASNDKLPTVTRLHAAPDHLWLETEDVQCFPEWVRLPGKACLDEASADYEVVAAMIHYGAHWVTVARNPLSHQWYLHDDQRVQVLSKGPDVFLPGLRSTFGSTRVKALLLWRSSGGATQLPAWSPGNYIPWTLQEPDDAQSAKRGVRQEGCVDITVSTKA